MTGSPILTAEEQARVELLERLERRGYDFAPLTPESQRRVLARPDKKVATGLRGVLGWSLPFEAQAIDGEILDLMKAGELIRPHPLGLVSLVRISRVHGRLYLHSAFPTEDEDSVFLGPDTCRFVDFILPQVARRGGFRRAVDIGTGAGVGGISLAAEWPGGTVELADINAKALGFARVNAAASRVSAVLVESNGLESIDGGFDLAIANPPFIFEEDAPAYRRGGGMHGAELSLNWAIAAAGKVAEGGCVLLYTGSAIVNGVDRLRVELEKALPRPGFKIGWREIDPDIFGEELGKPAYREVERIAAVGAVIEKVSYAGG